MSAVETTQVHMEERSEEVRRLSQSITKSSPADAAELLSGYPDSLIEEVLASLNPRYRNPRQLLAEPGQRCRTMSVPPFLSGDVRARELLRLRVVGVLAPDATHHSRLLFPDRAQMVRRPPPLRIR